MKKSVSASFFIWGAIFFLILWPQFISLSEHSAGLVYSSLSRNLSEGYGSPFLLHFTKDYLSPFYEHPPLFIWIQSLFFFVLGDQFLVEKSFSLLNFLLCSLGLFKILRISHVSRNTAFLCLALFCVLGRTRECYPGAMILSFVSMLLVWSCYYFLLFQKLFLKRFFFFSAFLIFLAFYSKGPVTLFPVLMPLCFYLSGAAQFKLKKLITQQFLFFSLVLILLVVPLLVSENLFFYMKQYFSQQVLASMSGVRVEIPNYFMRLVNVLWFVLKEYYYLVPIFLFSYFLKIFRNEKKWSGFFFLLVLASTLPLSLSGRFISHYLAPSGPFFILSMGMFCGNYLEKLASRLKFLEFRGNFLLLVLVAMFATKVFWKKPGYNKQYVEMALWAKNYVPFDSSFTLCREKFNWNIHGYFQRYGRQNLKRSALPDERYALFHGKCAEAYKLALTRKAFIEVKAFPGGYRLFKKQKE